MTLSFTFTLNHRNHLEHMVISVFIFIKIVFILKNQFKYLILKKQRIKKYTF